MQRIVFSICALMLFFTIGFTQGSRFGIKLGPTMSTQRWNYFQNGPLFKYHGDLWIESYDEEDNNVVFAQLGYHIKGSATRYTSPIVFQSTVYSIPTDKFIFRNASLAAGFKKKFIKPKFSTYYAVGLRGEYNLSTNLSQYDKINALVPIYPFEDAVKKVLLGATFSAGIDLPFSEYIGGVIELNIAPDITRQYYQPEIPNILDIFQPGRTTSIPERSIKNVVLEISLGVHFLRKVIYVD